MEVKNMTIKNISKKIIHIGTTPLMPDETLPVKDANVTGALKAMAAMGQIQMIEDPKPAKPAKPPKPENASAAAPAPAEPAAPANETAPAGEDQK